MTFDVQTLLLCDIVITACMGFALLFYRSTQRTFEGFGFWVFGTFVFAVAYSFSLFRQNIPEFIGILLTNGLYSIGALIRLDGIFRFMRGRSLKKYVYASPVLLFVDNTYFYFFQNDIVIRNFILSLYLCVILSVIIGTFLRYAPENGKALYRTTAFFHGLFGIELFARGIIWLVYPSGGLLDERMINYVHYLIVTAYEVGLGLSFLMMNGQRLEEELRKSKGDLQNTVRQLTAALSEIKTLSGLVPICPACKKIRDDRGFWDQVESYVARHTGAEFSHGICPECAKRLYPDVRLDE